jgi:hypothetical protein
MLSRLPAGALKKAGAFGAAARSASVSVVEFEQRRVLVVTISYFSNIQQVRFASSSAAPNANAFQVNHI